MTALLLIALFAVGFAAGLNWRSWMAGDELTELLHSREMEIAALNDELEGLRE